MTGIALPAFLPRIETLFATAVLCGLGFNMLSVSAQHTVGRLPHDSAGQRIAHFDWLGLSTSGILGPLIIGVVIDVAGYRPAFAVLTVSAQLALADAGPPRPAARRTY